MEGKFKYRDTYRERCYEKIIVSGFLFMIFSVLYLLFKKDFNAIYLFLFGLFFMFVGKYCKNLLSKEKYYLNITKKGINFCLGRKEYTFGYKEFDFCYTISEDNILGIKLKNGKDIIISNLDNCIECYDEIMKNIEIKLTKNDCLEEIMNNLKIETNKSLEELIEINESYLKFINKHNLTMVLGIFSFVILLVLLISCISVELNNVINIILIFLLILDILRMSVIHKKYGNYIHIYQRNKFLIDYISNN